MDLRLDTPSIRSSDRTWFAPFLYNAGYLFSYLLFPTRVWPYRLLRFFGIGLMGLTRGVGTAGLPLATGNAICIAGYRHSANSFLVSNVDRDVHALVLSHNHRAWEVRRAVALKLPVLLLVRDPKAIAESTWLRSRVGWNGQRYPIWPATTLLCWMLYHRAVMRFESRLSVVCFQRVIRGWPAVVEAAAARGVTLHLPAREEAINGLGNLRPVTLSRWASWLLRHAEARHRALVAKSI
ncbi:hypothetical protein [Sandaracinobacteroides saxicola]|uniref:Sulfotransferase family protein n=1 Tax=Sandaracinobacteroides saxicola TaxID=2759707 RepID=A0A7G5II66_9SPHN|nr:hypothetical protein [Sandaracinobacteroides saxicola]QMW23058.1 hypothetical protein H3309_00640 [Sandaracinobacteroides saxicola]